LIRLGVDIGAAASPRLFHRRHTTDDSEDLSTEDTEATEGAVCSERVGLCRDPPRTHGFRCLPCFPWEVLRRLRWQFLGRLRWATFSLAACLLIAGCGSRGTFPDQPILLVCPWAAGGGSDRIARQIAVLLEQDLGVPVNVVNVTGGDGVTGHSRGALARGDGYTLTLITVEIAMLHWRGMTNIGPADFAPVGLVNEDAAAIFVRADAPWRTLADLERSVREQPGKLRGSGTATAGIWHLALAGWLSAVGLKPTDVIWVSIAGSAPSLQELIAGGIDVVLCSLPEAQALLSAGRIRSLAVMADARAPQFPDVPTLKELGVNWTLGTMRAIAAPKDTPPERVTALAAALQRVVASGAYQSTMRRSGFTASYEDPARLAATLGDMDARLGTLLTSEALGEIATSRFGPMFFPTLLFAALAVVSLALMAGLKSRPPPDPANDQPVANPGAAWRFAEVLIWIALYLALAETLGFVLTAGVLLLAYLIRLGTRPLTSATITLLLVPAMYHVFAVILRVPLPRGLFGW
jgi:tripartite-type tricarboxylate transporter receptor subunit TctC